MADLWHSWGKSPKQKAREKEYNHWYYENHKNKWKNKREEVDARQQRLVLLDREQKQYEDYMYNIAFKNPDLVVHRPTDLYKGMPRSASGVTEFNSKSPLYTKTGASYPQVSDALSDRIQADMDRMGAAYAKLQKQTLTAMNPAVQTAGRQLVEDVLNTYSVYGKGYAMDDERLLNAAEKGSRAGRKARSPYNKQ